MSKLVALLVGAVIVVGGGAVFIVTRGDNDSSVKITDSASGTSQEVATGDAALVAVDACDVLTESVATQIIGDGATKGDTSAGNASSSDVSVSNCVYTHKTVTSGPALQQAASTHAVGVLVRAAKSNTGADSNKAQFSSVKPAGVQDVSGYGDKAFWNPNYGQMNVLKGSNWYIISNYVGLNATKGTLDQAKQLASLLEFK